MNGSAKAGMSLTLVGIAAVAMYGWIVSPHVRYLSAVQRYESVVTKAAEEKRTLCVDLGAKRRQLKETEARLDTLRAGVFNPEEAEDFLGNLETLGRKAGCFVTSVSFDAERGGARAPRSSKPAVTRARRASLTVSGRYDQIIALLNDLQTRPQGVSIDSCQIQLIDARSARLECKVALTIWVLCAGEESDE
jgi:Tfp pilus assembly protein PilO